MKRTFKYLSAVILAVMLVVTFCLPVSAAAGTNNSITITPTDENNHTYEAYQIIMGDVATDNETLSNPAWGDNIDTTTLLGALAANTAYGDPNPFATAATVNDVLDVLSQQADNSAFAIAFAKDAGNSLINAAKGTANTKENGKYVISGLTAGYYLVKDKDGTQNGEDMAYTLNLLKVAGAVAVTAKADVPTIDKKIIDGTGTVESNTASIGDNVPYILTSSVPDMTGYNKYYFVVNDTMSAGLTFNDDVSIRIGDHTLAQNDFAVTTDAATNSVKIVIKNFIQYADKKGDKIEITYSANVNNNADMTQVGNKNIVNLTYSNNPNVNYTGTDEPVSGEPTGETPDVSTKTYVTQIKLIKVDGSDHTKLLAGAQFKLEGIHNSVVFVSEDGKFVYDTAGTYWRLKALTADGKVQFTTTAPTDATSDQYYSTGLKFKKVSETSEIAAEEKISMTATTNAQGELEFPGLGAGTYTITELVAPDKYNLLSEPITVTITGVSHNSDSGCDWSVSPSNAVYDAANQLITLTVENNIGITLPGTGGIGTTVFYVVGGLMVCGAIVLLIVKKRMDIKEK